MVISPCCVAEDANKFTKIYKARAQPLFYSFNLLFSDVPVAVAVVVFLNSLLCDRQRKLSCHYPNQSDSKAIRNGMDWLTF